MKHDKRLTLTWNIRTQLLLRFVGMTSVLLLLASLVFLFATLPNLNLETIRKTANKEFGIPGYVALMSFSASLLAFLFIAIYEILTSMKNGSVGRGVAGISSVAQIMLASFIFIAINIYSFIHPANFDLTSNHQFTLPANIIADLQQLKSETTIVVLQQHKTLGGLTTKPDNYDYAAERKIIEKVHDTVELFRTFGPQFNVSVLDVEESGYDKKLAQLTENKPELLAAIKSAPENSIFFYSEGKVQRMSFSEFYQLDKIASKNANNKDGNLILYPQGISSFVKRIIAIDEKRPKVALAVTHPVLSSWKSEMGMDDFTLVGLRKSLEEYGIDVTDVVLKNNYRDNEYNGDPAALTIQESQLNRSEKKEAKLRKDVQQLRDHLDELTKAIAHIDSLKDKPVIERINYYYKLIDDRLLPVRLISKQFLLQNNDLMVQIDSQMLPLFKTFSDEEDNELKEKLTELEKVTKELQDLRSNERALEDQFLTDVKAKFSRTLDDCDLLIIPRLTILNATTNSVLPRNLHKLAEMQVELIKQFMKAGKPVLVLAGPTSFPSKDTPAGDDGIERLLRDRGFILDNNTILYNSESDAFREDSNESQFNDALVEVPSLLFMSPLKINKDNLSVNPITHAMEVLSHAADQPLSLKLRAPRTVLVTDSQSKAQGFEAEFLWTVQQCWNETYPFSIEIRTLPNPQGGPGRKIPVPVPSPRYDPPITENSKDKNSKRAQSSERRGPFSIAAAIESVPPDFWYDKVKDADLERKKSRVVVIGHGGIFNKNELKPAVEKLLLVTCNWLLQRDDRLPHAADFKAPIALDRTWEYPRVNLSDTQKQYWRWSMFLFLPCVCVYIGLIVLMFRKIR